MSVGPTPVNYALKDGIAFINLNNPPLNILNIKLMNELSAALDRASNDASARAVVVGTAIERAFSAGADVKEHLPDRAPGMLDAFTGLIEKVLFFDKPTVAAVKGACLGGGFELAIAFDFVVSGESAFFGTPEIRLGAMPPIAAVLLPRIIGVRRALRVVLLGENFPASEAERMGMLTKVVPDAEVDAEAERLARSASEISLSTIRIVKKAFWGALGSDIGDGFELVNNIYKEELLKTEDGVEGLKAFLEKRKPAWKDR